MEENLFKRMTETVGHTFKTGLETVAGFIGIAAVGYFLWRKTLMVLKPTPP
jgi:hypothetical protein